MEDVESPPVPSDDVALPEGNADPGDPLNPEIEEEHNPNAPMVNPTEDVELTGENEVDKDDYASDDNTSANKASTSNAITGDDDDDALSDALSDVDEAQFEDFDVANVAIEDRPAIAVDEDNIGVIGVHKRKRTEDGEGASKKKKREGRREKKSRRRRGEDEDVAAGTEEPGERRRKKKDRVTEVDDPNLTPEERRKRALERKMDAAAKRAAGGGRSGRRSGIGLGDMADDEIVEMRNRMSSAAEADTKARDRGEPAMRKLKLLPDVVALLNKNTYRSQLTDPDLNLLEAVRFFLEPLNDGSLPAYDIQRELFAALGKLPIDKDSLIASGIGKVVWFYTKSKRPQPNIKRQADKLMADWTRPILRRTDDYRKKEIATTEFDPSTLPIRNSQAPTQQQLAEAARKKALATPVYYNRARREDEHLSYTIAPRSNVVPTEAKQASKNPFTLKVQRGKKR